MSTGGVVPPGLQPPFQQIQQEFQQGNLQQMALQIQQQGQAQDPNYPLSVDDIVSQLQYLKDNGISLNQGMVDNLDAGEPALTTPPADPGGGGGGVVQQTGAAMQSNPWLNANPYAVLNMVMLDLAFEMAQAKLEEGLQASTTIMDMTSMAADIAQTDIEIGQTEFESDVVSGCMQLAGGLASIAGGIASMSPTKVGVDEETGEDIMGLDPTRAGAIQGITSGLSGALTGIAKITEGIFALQKAELEAEKTMDQNMAKIYEQRLSTAMDNYKSFNDMIGQTLQQLQKMIDEAYKAFGWQIH